MNNTNPLRIDGEFVCSWRVSSPSGLCLVTTLIWYFLPNWQFYDTIIWKFILILTNILHTTKCILLVFYVSLFVYSWLSLSRIRLTRISGWVELLSKSQTSLCINIYNLTPVESNSDESKFQLSRIKLLVPRCRKPYYLHSLSQIYLSKHAYYLRIKIGSQVKHPVIEFDT